MDWPEWKPADRFVLIFVYLSEIMYILFAALCFRFAEKSYI